MLRVVQRINKSLFSTLVLAEHNGKSISKNTLKLLSAANKFGEDVHVLVAGGNSKQISQGIKSSLSSAHIKKIFALNQDHPSADAIQNTVQGLMSKNSYKRVIGLSSSLGKDVIPRIAGKYQAQPISDITQIVDNKTFIRPIYAGNALSKVKSQQPIDFLTVRASSFSQPEAGKNSAQVQDLKSEYKAKAQFVGQQKSDSNKPELTTARIVVSGGRGVKNKQNFNIVYKLADAFGDAAVGASRAAVDAGYCPNELQVGQTGKVVAPDLYIAVGISGAVQHLAGMKDSKCIVVINNRPDEPIFQYADYGLVDDLFKVLPQLTEKVKKIKSG